MKDDFKKEPKMHAQLLTHDNHASGLGGEHSEDSLENHMTFTVDFSLIIRLHYMFQSSQKLIM